MQFTPNEHWHYTSFGCLFGFTDKNKMHKIKSHFRKKKINVSASSLKWYFSIFC